MSSSSSPPPPNFCSVLSESMLIFLAQRRHFLGLSLLFLLPLSFFSPIYYHFYLPSQILLRQYQYSPTTDAAVSIIPPLINKVSALFLSSLAVGSILFIPYNVCVNRPVKIVSSLLSLLPSFLPLLITSLASLLFYFLVLFGLVLFLIIGLQYLGFIIDQSSLFFIGYFQIIAHLLSMKVYLQVISWVLAYVVVVVESSRGFKALRRSTKLVIIAWSLMLFNGVCSGIMFLGCSYLSDAFDGGGDIRSWKTWSSVLRVVVSSVAGLALTLQYFLANTVLYMYCKAAHGEVDGEIEEEFAGK